MLGWKTWRPERWHKLAALSMFYCLHNNLPQGMVVHSNTKMLKDSRHLCMTIKQFKRWLTLQTFRINARILQATLTILGRPWNYTWIMWNGWQINNFNLINLKGLPCFILWTYLHMLLECTNTLDTRYRTPYHTPNKSTSCYYFLCSTFSSTSVPCASTTGVWENLKFLVMHVDIRHRDIPWSTRSSPVRI